MENVNRRWLVRTGTLSAGVLLMAALLVIVNYFGHKYHKRFDWTSSRLYTLSEKSENVVRDLEKDVDFIVFLQPGDELYEPVRELLTQYDAASQRVKVRYVDPQRDRMEAERLIQQYQISGYGVVVASGKDKRVIPSNDLAELDFSGMQMGQAPTVSGFKGEQLFTGAVLQLGEGRKPKVIFTTGHGERSLDDQGPEGLAGIQQLLGADNFDVEEWSALGKTAVPPGTDLVVVAGPRSPFLQPELSALAGYLNGGGRVLALVEPTLGQTEGAGGGGLTPTGFESWLGQFGVKLGNDIVIDPQKTIPGFTAATLYSDDYGDHPVTNALSQSKLPVLFSVARSVGRNETAGFTITELARTTGEGWGETNLSALAEVERDDNDVAGPVSLGVAVEAEKTQGRKMRLVVFGDSDFATNQLVQANSPNQILLSNALNWLVAREALLAIPPRKTEQVRLNLTQEQGYTVYAIALLLLPVLAAAAGIVVWSRRRR
ncbi:MAG TPA: GldG family protein [Thermoanaerobaculia bacterium]|nr:GldG family protein [Thermoanaerobaculia bacterium]